MDYQKAYALLVSTISNALDELDELGKTNIGLQKMERAIKILKEGLNKAEEMYLSSEA